MLRLGASEDLRSTAVVLIRVTHQLDYLGCLHSGFHQWAMESNFRCGRPPSLDSDSERSPVTRIPPPPVVLGQRSSRRKPSVQNVHPKPPLTPNTALPSAMPQAIPNPLLPSAPASPPTPAPSPTPQQRPASWHDAREELEHPILRDARLIFSGLNTTAKEAWLTSLVDGCDSQTLSFLHRLVSPKLKKDPFAVLPDELCLRVSFSHF